MKLNPIKCLVYAVPLLLMSGAITFDPTVSQHGKEMGVMLLGLGIVFLGLGLCQSEN